MADRELAPGSEKGRTHGKILLLIAEDWFAISHFVPLVQELTSFAREVVVATRSTGKLAELARFGVRTEAFDFHRGSLDALKLLKVRSRLAHLIDRERPDVIHAIAMQTMIMTSVALAASRHRPSAVILHVTGLGYLGSSRSPVALVLRPLAQAVLHRCARSQNVWLAAENMDDLDHMTAVGATAPGRTAIIPGAGVDPAQFPQLEPPCNAVPCAAYIGRMLHSKGIHVLVEAHRLLRASGFPIDLALYGAADPESRQAIPKRTLEQWNGLDGISWHGPTENVAAVWQTADISVVPALGGDGMPRAMLEAASCARPLVVSDVPGCRQFVRDGVEGFVAPTGDPHALAHRIRKLAADPQLMARCGAAARRRLLESYTTDAVRRSIRRLYAMATASVGKHAP